MARKLTNTKNSTKHAQQQDVTYILNKLFVCVLDFNFFNIHFRYHEMNFPRNVEFYRLGTVNIKT